MNGPPTLVIILVDALAATYVQPQTMPFLSQLAQKGGEAALFPSPFYAGIEPTLHGVSGTDLGCFTGYCFDPQRSPYRNVSQGLKMLDRFPRHRAGKLIRNLWARRLLKQAGGSWMAPQLFPSALLRQLAPPLTGHSNAVHIVHRLEAAGYRARWYTRDFPFEGKKWLGSQIYSWRYGERLQRWVLGSSQEEPPPLVLFELSVELDRLGHRYGPDLRSPLKKGLLKIDRCLESLWQAMQQWPRLHWLVTSDHGMSRVKRSWDLEGALAQAGLLERLRHCMIISSTLAQLNVPDSALLEELLAFLRESRQGTPIHRDQFPEYGIPADSRWGNLVFAVPEGTLLLPNHFQGRCSAMGMHGYASSEQPSSGPVAVLVGEQWRFEDVRPEMAMQELHPLILDLFELGREP